jgi:C4-dicarboxylate-binding protein DctP
MNGMPALGAGLIGRTLAAIAALALLCSACAPQRAAPESAKPAPGQAAAPAGQPAAGAPAMSLKFSHILAKDTPKGKGADKFAELVKQKSGGRIEVQVYPNSELYKDAEELEALQNGAIQFIAPSPDKFGSLAPEWDAVALPYLWTSDAAANKFMTPGNPLAQELLESLRPKGFLGLAVWGLGWKHFTNSKHPIKTPADFQGLKIRTSGKPDEALVKAMGGSATVMAFSELFGALQQGVVDGQYTPWANNYTSKFYEVQKYATISRGGAYVVYAVATNARWWDSLDADSRQILSDAMNEASAYQVTLSDKDNADSLEAIKQSGKVEFYEQTPEDARLFEQAAQPVIAEWEAKTGKDIIQKLKALN